MSVITARPPGRRGYVAALLAERFFPDDYCDCRCGPVHHQVAQLSHDDVFLLFCSYHKRECGRVDGSEVRVWA